MDHQQDTNIPVGLGHRDCLEYRQRTWQRPLSRRAMLTGALGVAAAVSASSHMLLHPDLLAHAGALRPGAGPEANILVVINQSGGNDGLSTVIPYTSARYYKQRPTLAVKASDALPLTRTAALHPHLAGMKRLYDAGHLAVVQGVGYPHPDLSHFQSIITWQTGMVGGRPDSGWLGRYLDTALGQDRNPLKAIGIGSGLPLAFASRTNATPTIQSLPDFQIYTDAADTARTRMLHAFREMNAAADPNPTYAAIRTAQITTLRGFDTLQEVPTGYKGKVAYPTTDLGKQLQLVAQLIHANLGTRVFWVDQDGYDEHAAEAVAHDKLLGELDAAVSAFQGDLAAHGWDRRVLLMTCSEFGRRVEENGDHGTDHGTAAPLLIVGGAVKGGVYGDDPSLTKLDANGNLVHQVDFRSVYRTVIDRWLGADPVPVLGRGYELLPFV